MLQSIIANLPLILSGASIVLTAVIGILHLRHKDRVANALQALEDCISKLKPPSA